VNNRLAANTVDKCLAADLVVRLQDVVKVLHDEVLVAHVFGVWRGVLDPDYRSNTVDIERVTLDLGCGVSLATVTRLVRLSSIMWYLLWKSLPPLQIVVEVVVERHRHVTLLYLEKKLGSGDRLLIPLDQVVGQLVDQRGANVHILADGAQSRADERVDQDDDIAHESHAHLLPFGALLLHAIGQESRVGGTQLESTIALVDLHEPPVDTFTFWDR
jgi:hypothetical protein